MRRAFSEQGGWALVTSIVMIGVMMLVGMATLAVSDFNSGQTRLQRERESALNLAEGVLYAQTFALARQWPGPNRAAYPATCTSAVATTGQCPNRDTLARANSTRPDSAAFTSVDFAEGTTWVTRVRDNYGAIAGDYNAAAADGALVGALGTCAAPCSRDFNDDKALWVQARAVVRGEARNIVALMKFEQLSEALPQAGLISGSLRITNNGAKLMVDAAGAQVTVRCQPDITLGNAAVCTNFAGTQISPLPAQMNSGNLMDAGQIARFRDRAIIDGTYHVGCPTSLTGRVVFIENCQDPPVYTGSGSVPCSAPDGMRDLCTNSIEQPGIVIVRCGALRMASNWTYVGLLYFVNGSDGSCPGLQRGSDPPKCNSNSLDGRSVLDTQGGFGVWGGIVADGNACVLLGSNGLQLKFDANVFLGVRSYGTVGLVQNTWRELAAGT